MLGTGFVWIEGQISAARLDVPEDESRLELSGLALGPGASRKIRLVLDRTVPERADGAFKPVLRVIEFKADGPTLEPRAE